MQNLFFIGSLWTRGTQFWQPCWNIFAKLPKTFAQVTKNGLFIYFTYQKCFSSNFSIWQVQCSFNKPLKSFPLKKLIVLAQNPNFFSKTYIARFFLWTRKKEQFWKSFRTKLPKSQIFSLLVRKHEQNRKRTKKLLSHKYFFWRSIRHF